MTSRRIPANLRLEIRPSRLLAGYIIVIHSAVLLCLFLARLPYIWLGASALLLLASAVYHVITLFSRSGPYFVRGIAWREGRWFILSSKGERAVEVLGSWVLPAAVGLQLKAGSRFRLLVLPDSCAVDDFRRLRQILRFTNPVPRVKDGIQRLG